MTRAEILKLFPHSSEEFILQNIDQPTPIPAKKTIPRAVSAPLHPIHEILPQGQSPCAKPQSTLRHESVAEEKGKGGHPRRLLVRVTSIRRRLLDYDNLIPKYFVDCLRYAGILSGDTEAEIDLRIAQRKTKDKSEEGTEIEIEVIE